MATQYDPTIIQKFADRLYDEASRIVATWAALGFVFGALVGGAFGATVIGGESWLLGAGVGALVFALVLAAAAQSRANALRLQAQTALCQVRTEWSTRRA